MPASEEPAARAADDHVTAGQWSQVAQGSEDPIDESAAAARLCQACGTLPATAGESVVTAAHRLVTRVTVAKCASMCHEAAVETDDDTKYGRLLAMGLALKAGQILWQVPIV